jgi:hypothetical protein
VDTSGNAGKEAWELRIFLGRDPITGRDRYKTRTFKGGKKKEAEKGLRALLATVEAAVVSEGTFGEFLERRYLVASTSRDWSPKMVAEHRRIIDKQLGSLSGLALNNREGLLAGGSDGGIFTYGDAGFYGSHRGSHLNQPIAWAAPTSPMPSVLQQAPCHHEPGTSYDP